MFKSKLLFREKRNFLHQEQGTPTRVKRGEKKMSIGISDQQCPAPSLADVLISATPPCIQ